MASRKRAKAPAATSSGEVMVEMTCGLPIVYAYTFPRALTSRFVTLAEDHPCWTAHGIEKGVFDGTFVRIVPPAHAADDKVEWLRAAVLKAGARAVKVVPRAGAHVLTEVMKADVKVGCGIREVVERMYEEANTANPDALGDYLEEVLVKVGI